MATPLLAAACTSDPDRSTSDVGAHTPTTTPGTARGTTVDIPDPGATLITRWAQDPWALGSYSYLPVGSSPDDRRALARPAGRLVLAGEATSVDHPSTVHGAVLSGRRAAEQVRGLAPAGGTVIVIGAGAAGLAAAADLRATHAVTVVEARDRTGGRVWTDRSLGYPVELGAGWIHGPDGNPLTDLARQAGVATVTMDWDDAVSYGADGAAFDVTPAETRTRDVLTDAATRGEELDADVPLADLASRAMDDMKLSGREREAVDRTLVTEVEQEFAADLSQLSGWWWDEGRPFGGTDLAVTGGYDRILAPLADGLDIRLGAPARSVLWSDSGAAVVLDGATVEAAAVVLTVPISVLQAGTPALDPVLPEPWAGAVGRLGMGVLDKVVLAFDRVFWDDSWLLQWRGPERGDFAEWLNLDRTAGHPALVAFNAGSTARRWEARTGDEVAAGAMAALRTIRFT